MMRVVIIGAGSIFFTRNMILGMAQSPLLRTCEVVLVDIVERKAEQMGKFCRKVNEFYGGDLKITWTTDRREVLPGADYVILAFAVKNYHYRETGTNLAKLYNINLASGETAGPSAVFRILRAVPEVLAVAGDIERLCPGALVVSYVNPTNVIATALNRHSKVRSYAFCDGIYEMMRFELAKYLGLPRMTSQEAFEQISMKIGGINHSTWMWDLNRNGESLWDQFKGGLQKCAEAEGVQSNAKGQWDLTRVFDAYPAIFSHNIEYLRYFQGKGGRPQRDYTVARWSLHTRIRWYRNVWKTIADCNAGKITVKQAFSDDSTDMLASLLESIEGDKNHSFTVNVPNNGIIPNLPAETVVEVIAKFGKNKMEIPPVGPLPAGLVGLSYPTIDAQELALEAAMTGNFRTVVKAIACDPLVMSVNDAEDLARELMAQEEDDMDAKWDSYWWNA